MSPETSGGGGLKPFLPLRLLHVDASLEPSGLLLNPACPAIYEVEHRSLAELIFLPRISFHQVFFPFLSVRTLRGMAEKADKHRPCHSGLPETLCGHRASGSHTQSVGPPPAGTQTEPGTPSEGSPGLSDSRGAQLQPRWTHRPLDYKAHGDHLACRCSLPVTSLWSC